MVKAKCVITETKQIVYVCFTYENKLRCPRTGVSKRRLWATRFYPVRSNLSCVCIMLFHGAGWPATSTITATNFKHPGHIGRNPINLLCHYSGNNPSC